MEALQQLTKEERAEVAAWMRQISAIEGSGSRATRIFMEADRFENCGHEFMQMVCEHDGHQFGVPVKCRSRICPECGRSFYRALLDPIMKGISEHTAHKKPGFHLSLLTLTFNKARFGQDLPAQAQLRRAYKETGKFLKIFYGKYKAHLSKSGNVVESYRKGKRIYWGRGWVAVPELGNDNNNLHFHCVTYGPYVDYNEMRAAWEKITGDSKVIDSQPVKNAAQAVHYVMKYVTKPPLTDSYSRLAQIAVMIKGFRRLRTGGIFYNQFKLPKRERLKVRCPFCGNKLRFDGVCHDLGAGSKVLPLYDLLKQRSQAKNNEFLPYPLWSNWYDGRGMPLECKILQ